MVREGLLVMSLLMLVMSVRAVFGSRSGLFRPPVLDTSPWQPVENPASLIGSYSSRHNSEIKKAILKNTVSKKYDTRKEKSDSKNDLTNLASNIRQNIILYDKKLEKIKDEIKQSTVRPNNIQDKLKILENYHKTANFADFQADASELRERRLEWSRKVEKEKGMKVKNKTGRDELRVERSNNDSLNYVKTPIHARKLAFKEDPIYLFIDDVVENRVHRSAFIDPEDFPVDIRHDEMTRSNNKKNTTNVQNANPHDKNKQFCVDISEYLDLKWVIKESEECHVMFTSQCEVSIYIFKHEERR